MFYMMPAFLLKTETVGTLGQNKACSTVQNWVFMKYGLKYIINLRTN